MCGLACTLLHDVGADGDDADPGVMEKKWRSGSSPLKVNTKARPQTMQVPNSVCRVTWSYLMELRRAQHRPR